LHQLLFSILFLKMPLYSNIEGRKIVYWLSNIGVGRPLCVSVSASQLTCLPCHQFGAGPLILSWINEICSDDTEKRALLVASANDLAYVVQAVVG
jgi:ACS family pantothenate transporter-like MFS transporter